VTQQINLFNPIFRKQKKYFSSVTMVQALGIIGLACVMLMVDATIRARALGQQAKAAEATLLARQQRLTDVKIQFAPRPKSATLAAEIAAEQSQLSMLQSASTLVQRGGFGDAAGFSRYFRAFANQSVDGLWLTELSVGAGGAAIGIEGNALQAPLVPLYMKGLAREPVMQGKAFATLSIDAVNPASAAVGTAPAAALPFYLKFSLQSVAAAQPAVAAK
jgi:hypothetical protein